MHLKKLKLYFYLILLLLLLYIYIYTPLNFKNHVLPFLIKEANCNDKSKYKIQILMWTLEVGGAKQKSEMSMIIEEWLGL